MPVYGVERPCAVGLPWRLSYSARRRAAAAGGRKRRCSRQPNGLCFSPDENLLYINDTEQTNIRVFDVDSGKLKNMRVFASGISDPAKPGAPDGMKCDAKGNIWVPARAVYGCLRRAVN